MDKEWNWKEAYFCASRIERIPTAGFASGTSGRLKAVWKDLPVLVLRGWGTGFLILQMELARNSEGTSSSVEMQAAVKATMQINARIILIGAGIRLPSCRQFAHFIMK